MNTATESCEQVIEEIANPEIMGELVALRDDIDRDPEDWPDGYTLVDALDDLVGRCEYNAWKDCSPTMKANLRDIEIALGRYVEISDEQLSRIIVSSGKKYSFKHRGKKYTAA